MSHSMVGPGAISRGPMSYNRAPMARTINRGPMTYNRAAMASTMVNRPLTNTGNRMTSKNWANWDHHHHHHHHHGFFPFAVGVGFGLGYGYGYDSCYQWDGLEWVYVCGYSYGPYGYYGY